MFKITKEFTWDASHILIGLPEGHKCGRLHGHTYTAIFELSATDVDAFGFVVDYGDLSVVKEYIDEALDHRHLNDVIEGQPSAELIAKHLYDVFRPVFKNTLKSVTVKETPKTSATYTGVL